MINIVGRVKKEIKIDTDLTISELAGRLGIRLTAYVPLKNGRPVTSDVVVGPEDDVTFLEVFSGG